MQGFVNNPQIFVLNKKNEFFYNLLLNQIFRKFAVAHLEVSQNIKDFILMK